MGYLVQPTFMSAGINKSINYKDWDIASKCPSPLILYMNIKRFFVKVRAGYALWLFRAYPTDSGLTLK